VDGNVIRVFARVFLLKGNLKSGPGHQKTWEIAEKLVPSGRPGDHNQALMELGATICLSENPLCLVCPLLSQCEAAQKGLQNELPEKAQADATLDIAMACLLVEEKGKILIKKRSEKEKWLKGLWEFPSAGGKTFAGARKKLAEELKVRVSSDLVKEVRHQITKHKIRLRLWAAQRKSSQKLSASYRWVERRELLKFPFASAQDQLRDFVLKNKPVMPDKKSGKKSK
jgi:A/G-specific adenine glycosylase